MSDTDYDAAMKLPEGKTCSDCIHVKFCTGITWHITEPCKKWKYTS